MNASPATVSRAGIIFVSDTDLDWSPVVEGWIRKRPPAEQPVFRELFTRFGGEKGGLAWKGGRAGLRSDRPLVE